MTTAKEHSTGDGLLDPVVVAALALLLANDHVFKAMAAGTPWTHVTGKLSDFAGVLFLPVLLTAIIELITRRVAHVRIAIVIAVVVAVMFTLMNTVDAVSDAYAWTLGVLQAPFRGGDIVKVAHTADAPDVVAIVVAPYVVWQTVKRASAR